MSQRTERPRPHDRRWARRYEMWRHQYLTLNLIGIILGMIFGGVAVMTMHPVFVVLGAVVLVLAGWRAYAVYSMEKELRWVRNG